MSVEIVTVDDLERFRVRLLADLAKMLQRRDEPPVLLKSGQVRKMLNVSPGTLQRLRVKGILRYRWVNKSMRYTIEDVQAAGQFIKKG